MDNERQQVEYRLYKRLFTILDEVPYDVWRKMMDVLDEFDPQAESEITEIYSTHKTLQRLYDQEKEE